MGHSPNTGRRGGKSIEEAVKDLRSKRFPSKRKLLLRKKAKEKTS